MVSFSIRSNSVLYIVTKIASRRTLLQNQLIFNYKSGRMNKSVTCNGIINYLFKGCEDCFQLTKVSIKLDTEKLIAGLKYFQKIGLYFHGQRNTTWNQNIGTMAQEAKEHFFKTSVSFRSLSFLYTYISKETLKEACPKFWHMV